MLDYSMFNKFMKNFGLDYDRIERLDVSLGEYIRQLDMDNIPRRTTVMLDMKKDDFIVDPLLLNEDHPTLRCPDFCDHYYGVMVYFIHEPKKNRINCQVNWRGRNKKLARIGSFYINKEDIRNEKDRYKVHMA